MSVILQLLMAVVLIGGIGLLIGMVIRENKGNLHKNALMTLSAIEDELTFYNDGLITLSPERKLSLLEERRYLNELLSGEK